MTLEEVHDHLFELLCTIDDICAKHHIRYFLDSGTALGAVRERNFIPWDDDMDIKVLMEDYPSFKKAMEKELPPYMHLLEPDGFAPAFYDYNVRIYDERYLLREETDEDRYYHNYQNYVQTDVYILSKAPDQGIFQKYMHFIAKIYYGMGMAHRYTVEKNKYSFVQNMQITVLRKLGTLFSVKKLWNQYYSFASHWQRKNVHYRFPMNYTLPNLCKTYPAEWYEETVFGEIRGRKFPVAGGYDKELTQLYGNYMEPPKDPSIYKKHL